MSPLIKYQSINFRPKAEAQIGAANAIIDEYQAQGFDLTLRQLFYQFVARGLIDNTQREYKNLGTLVNDARLAGLIDWSAIVDRTRNLRELSHWSSPDAIVSACAAQFRFNLWEDQPCHVEVWIEKDALIGVIEGVCHEFDVPHFSCRGYVSQSEMWGAAQRLNEFESQRCIIFHLGDHDPSGIDMTRDIAGRLDVFDASHVEVIRLALNYDQVLQYAPPPNPAKITDSRVARYIQRHGRESWELDALDPRVIAGLIRDAIEEVLDRELWDKALERQQAARGELKGAADRWAKVVDYLKNGGNE